MSACSALFCAVRLATCSVRLAVCARPFFQRGLLLGQGLESGIHLATAGLHRLHRGGEILQAVVLGLLVVRHPLLLAGEFGDLALQGLDLQQQGLATGSAGGFALHQLAGDVPQATLGVFADAREVFLGGHHLLLHQHQLLMTPPGDPGQGQGQGRDQHPQRRGGGSAAYRAGVTGSGFAIDLFGFDRTPTAGTAIVALRGQTRDVIHFIEKIVAHGRPVSRGRKTESRPV